MRGIVDYTNYDDMKYAASDFTGLILELMSCFLSLKSHFFFLMFYFLFYMQIKKLDDSLFRNQFSRAYVRVSFDESEYGFSANKIHSN